MRKHIDVLNKIFFAFIFLLLTGCQFINIEITGTATGRDGWTVVIKDNQEKIVYGSNVKDGKFHIAQQGLPESGYYILNINNPGTEDSQNFEIYLEPGKYNIQLNNNKISYPNITTSSDIQNELSAYRRLNDSLNSNQKTIISAEDNSDTSPVVASVVFLDDKEGAQQNFSESKQNSLDLFVNKYPNSSVGLHILSKYYKKDPVKCYAIFKKLSKTVQNSSEGEKIGNKLDLLIRLQPGKIAPAFLGTTYDGKPIDIKGMGKKIILVEFWRSGLIMNRGYHRMLVSNILPTIGSDLGIIGISVDTDKNDWMTAIKEDKLYWPQISDLKGLDSPNLTNWCIEAVPTYCLLDGQGRFIAWNISYKDAIDLIYNHLKTIN